MVRVSAYALFRVAAAHCWAPSMGISLKSERACAHPNPVERASTFVLFHPGSASYVRVLCQALNHQRWRTVVEAVVRRH
jgi:hypothetical protein